MSKYPVLNGLLGLEGKDLISVPIKELRKKLKDSCEAYGGVYNAKEMSSLLSKERRREKKMIYSAQERKRNDSKVKTIEVALENLEENAEELRDERMKLIHEINYYQKQIMDMRTQSETVCYQYTDEFEMILSDEILELLDPTQ